jgi:hypothetical protein
MTDPDHHAMMEEHYSYGVRIQQLEAKIERLRALIRIMLDEDPNDMAADGITVLDVWRKEARRALENTKIASP